MPQVENALGAPKGLPPLIRAQPYSFILIACLNGLAQLVQAKGRGQETTAMAYQRDLTQRPS